LPAILGIRGLMREKKPPKLYLPAPILPSVQRALAAMTEMQRYELAIDAVPMEAGSEAELRADLHVRAFKTHHPVPSLGYLFFDRVHKLRDEFKSLPGPEIGRRRKAGEDLFDTEEHHLLAYATDTLIRVIDTSPELRKVRVLIMECTFLDDRKTLDASRAGCHIHLDELLERVDDLDNEHIVLMHFSQIYQPKEVHQILASRCPKRLRDRMLVFAPQTGVWPG